MENTRDLDYRKNLVNVLTLGRELAKQLQGQLSVPSSSRETREMLIQNILVSYEQALSLLNVSSAAVGVGESQNAASSIAVRLPDSPHLSGSPKSEDSDHEFVDQDTKDVSKKRKNKSMLRWTNQVRVDPGVGVEGSLEDGFGWRKYGQKDILGAKFPRGYYRCIHRNIQGCLATKQVQRSDNDPLVFKITYRGRHTCAQHSHVPVSPSQSIQKNNKEHQQQNQNQQQELLFNFQTGLKVITEDLDSNIRQPFPSIFFPSTSNTQPENQVLDYNNFAANFTTAFTSPNSISGSTQQVKQNYFQNSECELTEILSAATSVTNSPTVGFDFPFGNVDFDSDFTFDSHGFLS